MLLVWGFDMSLGLNCIIHIFKCDLMWKKLCRTFYKWLVLAEKVTRWGVDIRLKVRKVGVCTVSRWMKESRNVVKEGDEVGGGRIMDAWGRWPPAKGSAAKLHNSSLPADAQKPPTEYYTSNLSVCSCDFVSSAFRSELGQQAQMKQNSENVKKYIIVAQIFTWLTL